MRSKNFIIAECLKLFLQKGFKDVTMKDIVKTTGLSNGAFYHYFNSKEQLFMEIIDQYFTGTLVYNFEHYSKESLYLFYQDHLKDLEASIGRLVKEKEQLHNTAALDMNYLYPIFDAMRILPAYADKVNRSRQAELNAWTSAVEHAKISGEIKSSMTNEQLARLFLFSGNGTGLFAIMTGIPAGNMVKEYRDLWEALYNSLKTK
jgi:TetR/AcrR family transcriptional regulator, transcriptional repressor for nem operon